MPYSLKQLKTMRGHFLSLRGMIHEELLGAMPVSTERRRVIDLRLETVNQVVAEIERSDPRA